MNRKQRRRLNNLKKMIYQVNDDLLKMCRISKSKKEAKQINSKDPDVKSGKKSLLHDEIFSFRTFRKYRDICCTFLRWCNQQEPEIGHYSLFRNYVGPYLKDCRNRGLSIKTTSNYRAALVKLYGFSPDDFNIKKLYGRAVNVDEFYKYRYFSENNKNWFKYEQLTTFLTCTGLRKNEIRNLRGTMSVLKNGEHCIHVCIGSKGGRERFAKIIGTDKEKESIVRMMKQAGEERVFEKIPDCFSYHILRSIYACRYIDMVASDTESIPEKLKYRFKGEARGYCVDKRGMKEVSNSLGHNRIGVIRNYFRKCLFNSTKGKEGLQIAKEVYDLLKKGEKFT